MALAVPLPVPTREHRTAPTPPSPPIITQPQTANVVPLRPVFRRSGDMEKWELYDWHKRNGTLHIFWGMFPP